MAQARRTLAGRYRLAEVIGRGGMGTVYRAEDLVLGREVAVKLLPGRAADQDPADVARFEREARAAAALNHPALVAVYDAGSDAAARFIVMELVAGRSLEAMIRDDGPVDGRRAAAIAAGVADALAAAHAAGFVHRDIKPANVMIAPDGSVKVLDFGIARVTDGTALTQNASVLGTAAYMSPEQALGEPADQRSDIYSLGCVLYALLTGGPPFTGDGVAAIVNQHANVEPRPLPATNGRISPALAALVMRMLAKAPGERPQTAAEVRDELRGLPRGSQPTPDYQPVLAAPGATEVTRVLPPTVAPAPGRARSRILAWGALLAAAILVVIAIAALAPGGAAHHPRTAAARTNKRHHHHRAVSATRTSTTTAPTSSTSATSSPPTVSQAAAALTALTTQDVQAGTIDQQAAQQITSGLSAILNSYGMGHTNDVQHELANLSQQVAQLELHGDITAAAAPAITRAIGRFAGALARGEAAQSQGQGPQGQGPPGQEGGGPPGQGGPGHGGPRHGHGHGQGDGGDGGDGGGD
jgi:serine/threonine-protein kinase